MNHETIMNEGVEKYIASLELDPIIKKQIALLTSDLYSGPIYFDEFGETCSFGDEGATQMNFPAMAANVMDILDDVEGIWIETWSGCADYTTKEPDWDEDSCQDWIQLDAGDVLKMYLGSELYSTIR